VQQRFAKGTQPATPRANCRQSRADGKAQLMCPSLVPGDAYYARIKELDDAVAKAEEDLAEADARTAAEPTSAARRSARSQRGKIGSPRLQVRRRDT
jgi:hypothetical protein